MATVYRFIVENKTTGGGGGGRNGGGNTNKPSKKTTAKKGRWVSIFGGDKGGVEHNRKMRAINPLINKMTGGYWETGMRVGRAAAGLITKNTETGKLGVSLPAIAILIAFIINIFLKWNSRERQIADKRNMQNFKSMENGTGAIRGQYSVSVNLWNGARTFNQNK